MSYNDLVSYIESKRTPERIKAAETFRAKINEYKKHFGADFAYDDPFLNMSEEDIMENIDKCIKYNREWVGFIVPEEDFSDPNIMY